LLYNYQMNFVPIPLYSNDGMDTTADVEVCAICLDNINIKPTHTLTECNHTFHATCLIDALRANTSCPLCRGISALTVCRAGATLRHIIAYSKSKKNTNKRLRSLINEYEKSRNDCTVKTKMYQQFCKDQKVILTHYNKLRRDKSNSIWRFRRIKRIVSSIPILPINR
jgi:hypothetical protein